MGFDKGHVHVVIFTAAAAIPPFVVEGSSEDLGNIYNVAVTRHLLFVVTFGQGFRMLGMEPAPYLTPFPSIVSCFLIVD